METKGERRDRKKESEKKTLDNRKSINLIMNLIKKRSDSLKSKKKK